LCGCRNCTNTEGREVERRGNEGNIGGCHIEFKDAL
jgi:hypothetical protein